MITYCAGASIELKGWAALAIPCKLATAVNKQHNHRKMCGDYIKETQHVDT